MSILQYQEAINASDLQIWNNAAFDNGESEDSAAIRASWSPLKPIFVNRSESLDSVSSKENQSPGFGKTLVSVKTPVPVKPLHPNGAIGNSQGKPTKLLFKQGLVEEAISKNGSEEEVRDEKKIDSEIEEIEMEISRLSSRLEALRVEKVEKNAKRVERRGRAVPAKFMEQKQSVKNSDGEVKKIEEPSQLSARTKVQRRGVSLGPSEIIAGVRRGVSLGPSEIIAGVKSRQVGNLEITPSQPIQNRRKSCFWKLQDIDEEKVTKERGKGLSLSQKSWKTNSKIPASRQAATTVGSKKTVKKEDGVLSTIQPKKLFKDGEKSVPGKKTMKPGRVVASRYNQSTVQSSGNSAMRKRSLPENDKDDSKRTDKKRASSVGKSRGTLPEISHNQGMESRVKKQWEIPSEVVVLKNLEDNNSPLSVTQIQDMLPSIKTIWCPNDSPRDSGPAKRVAELIGRKPYFCLDGEVEPSVCQVLNLAEEDVEE
uniref:Uncharacterized protein n=1 Tax=Davidia involucrata TaxID=16924 RepID=A0A5B7BUM3_DAVIN